MAQTGSLKAKVCLVGEIAVGKTSLVRRFAFGNFDEMYSTTLGINISKKIVELVKPRHGGPPRVEMVLFDVMGQRKLRDLLVESYFKGAQALLAVWDVTRPQTLQELPNWIDMARDVAGPIPVVIAANKTDLSGNPTAETAAMDEIARRYASDWVTTSAKTGENVEAAFHRLAEELARRRSSKPSRTETKGRSPTLESLARSLVEESPRKD